MLFSKIYSWAGEIRRIDISKEDTRFCTTARIEPEANKIFNKLAERKYFVELSEEELIEKLAELYGDLNLDFGLFLRQRDRSRSTIPDC